MAGGSVLCWWESLQPGQPQGRLPTGQGLQLVVQTAVGGCAELWQSQTSGSTTVSLAMTWAFLPAFVRHSGTKQPGKALCLPVYMCRALPGQVEEEY